MNLLEETNQSIAGDATHQTFAKRPLVADLGDMAMTAPGSPERIVKLFETVVHRFQPFAARVDFRKGVSTESQSYLSEVHRNDSGELDVWLDGQLISCQCAPNPRPTIVKKKFDSGELFMAVVPLVADDSGIVDGAVGMVLDSKQSSQDLVLAELEAMALIATVQSSSKPASTASSSVLQRVAHYKSTVELGYSLVNLLADRYECEQVSYGEVSGANMIVKAISGVASFKKNSPGVVEISQSMEECLDRNDRIVVQSRGEPEVDSPMPIHKKWSSATGDSSICSLPVRDGDRILSVISLRRRQDLPFKQSEIEEIQKRLIGFGPAMELIRKAHRSPLQAFRESAWQWTKTWLGKGAWGRKCIAAAVCLAMAYFFFGSTMYRPACNAIVKPAHVSILSAPFESTLKAVHVKPGDQVVAGTILIELDTRQLDSQLAAIDAELGLTQVQLRDALVTDEITGAAILQKKMDSLRASREVLQLKKDMSIVRAPFDGIVTESDLATQLGQVVKMGSPLLSFAENDSWNIEISVPDAIASHIESRQSGTFAALTRPSESMRFDIEQINQSSDTAQNQNVFVAKAKLTGSPAWMKSGMKGMVRIETVQKPVWWVTLHRVIDTVRINFWI